MATPHVLSQVSDLTDRSGEQRRFIRELFKSTIAQIAERHSQHVGRESRYLSGSVSAMPQLRRLSTVDVQLQVALSTSGFDALNFNNVRVLLW